jgi:hypothetical protein
MQLTRIVISYKISRKFMDADEIRSAKNSSHQIVFFIEDIGHRTPSVVPATRRSSGSKTAHTQRNLKAASVEAFSGESGILSTKDSAGFTRPMTLLRDLRIEPLC